MSMKDDLAHRSPDIHWPTGFEPEKADLFAHNDLIINATCERVWTHIIEASRWPTWYPNSKDVEIQGGDPVLRDGTATCREPSRASITPGIWSLGAPCATW
jgi:hypothetical protein